MSATATPTLPENAPFNASQRAWLNGFFAGIFGRSAAATAGAPSAVVEAAPAAAPEAEEEFPWHDAALSMDQRMALVENKPFNRQLMGAMAQLDCGACGYLCKTYSEAIADGSEKDLTKCSPGGRETSKKLKELFAKGMGDVKIVKPSEVTIKRASVEKGKHDRNHPFPARMLKNEKLNSDGSAKDTRLICLDLKGSGLDYTVGDSLGVYPENCTDTVEWILEQLDCSGAEDVTGTDGNPTSMLEALHRQRTITKPSDELLQLLADSATDNTEEAELREMLRGDGAPGGTEVLDLLVKYPSARPTPEEFVESLTPIAPRLYSIASSLAAHPNEVHLTVGVVRYLNDHGRQCKGVASTFLADRMKPGMKARVFLQPSHGFRLPSDGNAPVIMVGPGTGIAPFRAFLQERAASGSKGKNWLFFGDQHEASDFLYKGEIDEYQKSGVLSRLDTAFSRDGDKKLYVQNRMHENGAELWAWLQNGGCFYVCGDAKRMAKDVDAALKQIIAKHGGMSDEAAAGYVNEMAKNKRYLRDVY